ncbi:MAG: DUF819 family protein [Pseudomonadota bacterium]
MLLKLLQVAFLVLVPALMLWLESRSKIVRTLSAVVFCYLAGIAIGNQPYVPVDSQVSLNACTMTIVLAIPLLLFSLNLPAWLKLAKATIISFLLILVSVMVMSFIACKVFAGAVEESPKVAGMLVGVYSGGTVNMSAIGTALGVKPETFLMVNAADIVMGGAYLPLLLTVVGPLLALILPATKKTGRSAADESGEFFWKGPVIRPVLPGCALAVALVAVAWLISLLFPGGTRNGVIILAITTLAVAASFAPKIRALPKTSETGQYLLLVFCVAIGSTADFAKFFSSTFTILLYTGMVMYGAIALHLLLAFICRLDRDTVIITSTAAIYGPAFVGPVAMSLKNREVIFSGIATGLVGIAVGNYLGLAVAWLLL